MDQLFRCRINNVDHYQAKPLSEFDPPLPRPKDPESRNYVHKISVLRVFGATPTGQKVLMHIHGVLQYTFIEYSGSFDEEQVNLAIQTLHTAIDNALAISYRQNHFDAKNRYVAHITLVKGVPFYGYHVGYKSFFKIYLLNPMHMTRLADLLREGAVMKRVLQPYESHMQYIAQWMCDYNLYGCAYMDCKKVKFRSPIPDYFEVGHLSHPWHDQSIPPEMVSDEAVLAKQSHCALEVDVRAEDIVNRHSIETRDLHHDFIERLEPLPVDKKLVPSMRGLWKDETRRRKIRMGLSDPRSTPFSADVLMTMSADPRNVDEAGWIHELEFREKIAELAKKEHEQSDGPEPAFGTFITPLPGEHKVQTALQSIEDLYGENMKRLVDREHEKQSSLHPPIQSDIDGIVDTVADCAEEEANSDPKTSVRNGTTVTSLTTPRKTQSSSNSSDSDLKTPLSSSEFAELGIREVGDMADFNDDRFEISSDFLLSEKPKKSSLKRARPMTSEPTPKKKPRFADEATNEAPDSDTGLDIDEPSDELGLKEQVIEMLDTAFEGQEETDIPQQVEDFSDQIVQQSLRKRLSQQSTLQFVVVKDPNDPDTIKRLSQQSGSPEKKSITTPSKAQMNLPRVTTPATVTKAPLSSWISKVNSSPGLKQSGLRLRGLPRPGKSRKVHVFCAPPPSSRHVTSTMRDHGLPDIIYQNAYYSKECDVPERNREYAGKDFKLQSTTVPYLPAFDPNGSSPATYGKHPSVILDHTAEDLADRQRRQRCTHRLWSIAAPPPSRAQVAEYHVEKRRSKARAGRTTDAAVMTPKKDLSQIEAATPANKHGFKYSSRQESTSVQHETQYMSIMSLEVHVNTRGSLAPNPDEDQIACVFWCIQSDDEDLIANTKQPGMHAGILVLSEDCSMAKKFSQMVALDVEEEQSELELLTRLVDIVRFWDPDILTGYEVHNNSWGYLIERARVKYDMNLCDDISRMKSQSHGRFGKDEDRWGFNHTSTIRVTGRHTINIWRAMRSELNLLQYTMENVVFHLIHKRIPHYTFADLTKWYKSDNAHHLAKVIDYFSSRVQIDLQILEANELVPRTSEQARLIGVDWFSVISRGSQYKVENIMFRIAKPENFMLASPSRRQVGGQNALECLPLVMEPQSDFYTSPMLVFDFQSLYPSVMIAYNYCYSTFLGRVTNWRGASKMGFTNYQRQERLIELLKDHINVSPNGIMYAKSHIRRSLLAKMLSEILETRIMVKSGMKVDEDDKTLQRLLNNRQLALKLIANVTYGYTSASFSGRMPCSEIADSIVQTGRETLERAIALIHSVERWGAEVVYGDTDSLFVHMKGRTREEAFRIGDEIAKTITDMNPRPVKLKFEKVYQPCVLLAKKRYVGFKYESASQTVPEFEAKGIETVRRDGTPAEQKIEENALKVLFRTSDLSQVKKFFQAQCAKIMKGKISIQDFCFAREVKLGTYSDKGPPPPGALISARRMLEDPRLEPQYGERVPYVVVTGGPRARLIDRCVAPDVLLNDAQQELDAEYYISKNVIPPLERIFNLVGANVRQWYDEMPKYQRIRQVDTTDGVQQGLLKKSTLESYMRASNCVVCRDTIESKVPLCQDCLSQPAQSLLVLRAKLTRSERKKLQLEVICRSCSGFTCRDEVRCDSKDCPVFYSRVRQGAALANSSAQLEPVVKMLQDEVNKAITW